MLKKGAPSDSFHWPCDLAFSQEAPGFGYITPLREKRFQNLGEVLMRRADPTFHTLTTAGLSLAESFLRLHLEGFCYSHFSTGNIYLDMETGEVLVCETDDVCHIGEDWAGSLGTPRFLAPELIGGRTSPNAATDLHTLAVILFHIFMGHHPLEGRLEAEIPSLDAAAMARLYGEHPVFIFDPKNLSNRPVPGLQENALTFWNFYPGYVREIFQRAFTAGLHDPKARVTGNEWRTVFTRMRDQIYYCDHCEAESFLSDFGNSPGQLPKQDCWRCHQPLPPPLRIRLAHHAVVLNQNTVLYAHHLDAHRRNDFSQILAEMSPHPTRPDVWGLKNLSSTAWSSHSPSGPVVPVPIGRTVALVPGQRLRFGNVEGTVL
jgi:serine/threonine protein kinase